MAFLLTTAVALLQIYSVLHAIERGYSQQFVVVLFLIPILAPLAYFSLLFAFETTEDIFWVKPPWHERLFLTLTRSWQQIKYWLAKLFLL